MPFVAHAAGNCRRSCFPKAAVAATLTRPPWPQRLIAASALIAFLLETATAAAPAETAAPALSAGSIAQVLVGLVAVLAMVAAAAWLLRKFSSLRGTGSGAIRIVGAAAVGQRERIVLVEVGGTWLLVGVAPGQVRALHSMPRADSAPAQGAPLPAPVESDFSSRLRRMTDRRNHD